MTSSRSGVPGILLPRLLAMLQSVDGTADQRIHHALEVVAEQLDVQTVFVSRFSDEVRRFTHMVGPAPPDEVMIPCPVAETVCHLIAIGAVGPVVGDTAADGTLKTHPHVLALGIGAYVGVPLVIDGQVVGAVCGVAYAARPALTRLDADRLATVGAHVGQVLTEAEMGAETGARAPQRASGDPDRGTPVVLGLPQLAAALVDADSLEALTRPLLELVQATTGLESTLLTLVDWAADEQHVVHSLNTGDLAIPEGFTVRWSDTLCRRSLDDKIPYTRNVPSVWGDSESARALGIQTYISVPITDGDDAVMGTLCGVSTRRIHLDETHLKSMRLFARILAEQFNREQARERETIRVAELEQHTRHLQNKASHDDLTGLLNRPGIHTWLASVLPHLQATREQVGIAFIDVDDFKTINDVFSHAAGDQVLKKLAASLQAVGRPGDLHGRLGGDEFVAAAILPATAAALGNWANRLHKAAQTVYAGKILVHASVGVVTVSDPSTSPATALHQADAAMYERKNNQRNGSTSKERPQAGRSLVP